MSQEHTLKSLTTIQSLVEHLNTFNSSQQTIQFLTRWFVENFDLYGSAYVGLHSGKGTGVEWQAFFPERLFTSKLYEVDFNELALAFQRTRAPFLLGSEQLIASGAEAAAWAERHQIDHALVVPLQFELDIDALILLYRNRDQAPFANWEIESVTLAARLITNVLRWQLRAESEAQSVKELDLMLRASLNMTESLNLNEVLNSILKNALELLPDVNDAHFFLYENSVLNLGAAMFQNGVTGKVWAEPREDGITYRVARSGSVIQVDDMRKHVLFDGTPGNWQGSIIAIPLRVAEEVLGVMTLAKIQPSGFSSHETGILNRLATQAAIVIHNIRTHDLIALQAFTDSLTALPNRRSFEWEAQKILDQSQRYQRVFTIVMLDLDEFKRINDTYGHAIGDDTLRIVAECMRSAIRKSDFLARFGGDEFVILFPETTKEIAAQVLQNLVNRLDLCRIPVRKEEYELLTISFGMASFPEDGTDLGTLIQLADDMLYRDKLGK